MKRKWFGIGILILLVLLGFWVKRERNLGEILDISQTEIWQMALEEHYNTGVRWESDCVQVEENKDVEVVLQTLNEIDVTLKGWSNRSDLSENEKCYDVKNFDNGIKWVRLMENGEVRILFMGQWIYDADTEDVQKGIEKIIELIEKSQ